MKQLQIPSLENGQAFTNPSEQEVALQPPPEPIRVPFSKEDEQRITKMLFTLFLTQKRYGMSPDDIPAMGKAYSWALRGYTYKDVYEAVTALVRKMPDIPTPADIIKRIDENKANQPCLPTTEWWIDALAKEIGQIPARSWFGGWTWDGKNLTPRDNFSADFVMDNYKKHLTTVLGEWVLCRPDTPIGNPPNA